MVLNWMTGFLGDLNRLTDGVEEGNHPQPPQNDGAYIWDDESGMEPPDQNAQGG